MKHPEPKSIIFDIETSHDILASHGLREQYHAPKNILQDWFMICVCWKWLGGTRIHGSSMLDDPKRFKKNQFDDYAVVKRLHEVLQDAEVIIGHNIHKFDWRKFMARVIYHGLDPLPKPAMIDTLKEARKIAAFTSNSMAYLAKYLNVERKLTHADDLWLRILRGDVKAHKEILEYCKGDITTTEAIYLKLRPYMESHPNANLWRADGIECCKKCGGEHIKKDGFKITTVGKYQAYKCTDCGSWMQGTKSIKRVTIK